MLVLPITPGKLLLALYSFWIFKCTRKSYKSIKESQFNIFEINLSQLASQKFI